MKVCLLHQVVVHCAAHVSAVLSCEVPVIASWSRLRVLHNSQGRAFSTWTSARLDDEDILSTHTLFNLNPGLADLELAKEDLCGRDAEVVADSPEPLLAGCAFIMWA